MEDRVRENKKAKYHKIKRKNKKKKKKEEE